MNSREMQVANLFQIRNQYGSGFSTHKEKLIDAITEQPLKTKWAIKTYYNTLLFLIAYPDNKSVYERAITELNKLCNYIQSSETLRHRFYNSGLTGSQICADFSFEIVKWLRKTYKENIILDSIDGYDGEVHSVLSAVMPQVESEILQDENATWREWLKKCTRKGDDLLDTLIAIFDQSNLRPEIKDELWTSLRINVTVNLLAPTQLPSSLTSVYYHRSLIKSASMKDRTGEKPQRVALSTGEAEKIIECGRMVLVRYIREIDPISFSDPELITYYKLSRGLSIALFGMRPERRHPIDSYMGYVVFKNGLPVSYAGSWILFDSARIALNVFAPYRGGESLYIFEQILKAHKSVYHLKRFTADPYQIGKNNTEGLKSGAFWTYYKLGFRPMRDEVRILAETEAKKLFSQKGYRSPLSVLKKLADSRLELIPGNHQPVRFDATDLSLLYRDIVENKYGGNRKIAARDSFDQLIKLLKPARLPNGEAHEYILKNWCVILMAHSAAFPVGGPLRKALNKLFNLKALGNESEYIREVQRSVVLRQHIEAVMSQRDFS